MTTPWWGRGDPRNGVPPWMWPVVIDAREREAVAKTPLRIGDAERDEAVSALGDHFAAGRLTRAELDERVDKAMQAKFSTDLDPLFVDLPKPAAANGQPAGAHRGWQGRRAPSPLFLLIPLLVVALVVTAAVLAKAPLVLFGLIWIVGMGRYWRGRWGGPVDRGHWHDHRPGPPAHYR